LDSWNTMDSWLATGPMRHGFRRTAPQRARDAKPLARTSKSSSTQAAPIRAILSNCAAKVPRRFGDDRLLLPIRGLPNGNSRPRRQHPPVAWGGPLQARRIKEEVVCDRSGLRRAALLGPCSRRRSPLAQGRATAAETPGNSGRLRPTVGHQIVVCSSK
jgi:hypothetical protein